MRSDLYSVGITLYQMLTGALPFSAADPLEWVHCHVARQPTPPGDRAAVPEPLSSHHEAPHQKRRGALPDRLRPGSRSSAVPGGMAFAWSHRSLPSGAHDASDRFLIPEKLYGREREIDALLAGPSLPSVHECRGAAATAEPVGRRTANHRAGASREQREQVKGRAPVAYYTDAVVLSAAQIRTRTGLNTAL